MQRSAPRPLSQTPYISQCVANGSHVRWPRGCTYTHTLLTTTAQLQLVCGCDVTRVRLSQADPTSAGRRDIKRSQVFAAAAGIELRASQWSARVLMGCTKHSLYRHGGKRSGMVCVQRRRSRTRASGQIRTVRRAHLRVRVLTARQMNSVRALQTAGRDAAEGPGDSVAARLRQP
jgi:hypothetical protein